MDAIGIDIGSSGVKVCHFQFPDGAPPSLKKRVSRPCPLIRPQPGWVEHDLPRLESALRELILQVPDTYPMSFASAMHALVPLDADGKPLSQALSWADNRSAKHASVMSAAFPDLHQRTGTPVHPMGWPAKLRWLRFHRAVWWNRMTRVTDLKSYLLETLTERPIPMDLSNASATGLWDQQKGCWAEDVLEHLQVPKECLPPVHLTGDPLLWKGRPIYLGGGDGPLGNLGVGAVLAGRTAISVGTSGAVRQPELGPGTLSPALFRYAVNPHLSVRGGAISNGTSVMDWLMKQYGVSFEQILGWLERTETGAKGLRVYPYFSGERAPFWRADVSSHILGLSFEHEPADLARATLEGVAFCLRRLLSHLEPPTEPLRCTGGFFTVPFWRQLLADVSGFPVAVSPIKEATALGAALMTLGNYQERAAALPLGEVTEPRQEVCEQYEDLYQAWAEGEPHMP
jgi:gluconokinase